MTLKNKLLFGLVASIFILGFVHENLIVFGVIEPSQIIPQAFREPPWAFLTGWTVIFGSIGYVVYRKLWGDTE